MTKKLEVPEVELPADWTEAQRENYRKVAEAMREGLKGCVGDPWDDKARETFLEELKTVAPMYESAGMKIKDAAFNEDNSVTLTVHAPAHIAQAVLLDRYRRLVSILREIVEEDRKPRICDEITYAYVKPFINRAAKLLEEIGGLE
jgi:hypothetical protein